MAAAKRRAPDQIKRPGKLRADLLLVERGLAESRSRAQALLLAGKVFSGETRIEKAGQLVESDAALEVRGQDHPWVSRGGIKLAHALEHFAIDPKDCIVLDVGASTGGFTDVCLQRGAKKVYAVDAGHGQLAWSLREDPRVMVLEKTNARHLTADIIPEPVDLIVCDVSFIGLEVALPAALVLAAPNAHLVALIKPQFEVGKGQVGKGGVVREPALHKAVCDRIEAWLAARSGWQVIGVTPSPIKGPEGNIEFLIAARHAAE